MRGNRRRDTAPEVALRSALHARGWRFRVDLPLRTREARSRPDIVFTRRGVAVFVDGCFWHGCPEHGVKPKANAAFWREKIHANRARDRRNDSDLRAAGWTVVRVWEHEDPEHSAQRIESVVRDAARRSGGH